MRSIEARHGRGTCVLEYCPVWHALSPLAFLCDRSYEAVDLYSILEQPPQGVKLDFVKAEHSSFMCVAVAGEREEVGGREALGRRK